jgi:hypothetical protein
MRRLRQLKKELEAELVTLRDALIHTLPDDKQKRRALQNCDKNALTHLLTCLRIAECGRELSRREWHDMMAFHLGLAIPDLPPRCICGSQNSVEHALVCRKGHFQTKMHDEVRDYLGSLLRAGGCTVGWEPLIPLPPEDVFMPRGTNLAAGARSDLQVWGLDPQGQSIFVDVRISFPDCKTHKERSPSQIHEFNQKQKEKHYSARIKFNNSRFVVFSCLSTGHLSERSHSFLKGIAHRLSRKAHAPGEVGYTSSYNGRNAYITSMRSDPGQSRLAFIIARVC